MADESEAEQSEPAYAAFRNFELVQDFEYRRVRDKVVGDPGYDADDEKDATDLSKSGVATWAAVSAGPATEDKRALQAAVSRYRLVAGPAETDESWQGSCVAWCVLWLRVMWDGIDEQRQEALRRLYERHRAPTDEFSGFFADIPQFAERVRLQRMGGRVEQPIATVIADIDASPMQSPGGGGFGLVGLVIRFDTPNGGHAVAISKRMVGEEIRWYGFDPNRGEFEVRPIEAGPHRDQNSAIARWFGRTVWRTTGKEDVPLVDWVALAPPSSRPAAGPSSSS